MKKFDIVTFGSAVVDAMIRTNAKEKNNNIIIPYGCKMLMKELYFTIGGGGTNTAVAFSRFGFRTGYVGKIGNDHLGKEILDMLKEEKIKFLGKQVKEDTSGFSVVLMSKNRNRSILTHKGINDEISEKDVNSFETSWLYLSSLMGQSFKTQIKFAKKLRKKGTKVAFNPSEYLIKEINIKPLLKICDVVIMNEEEASLLTKKKDKLKEIQKLTHNKKGIVVITNGKKEIKCRTTFETQTIKPPKIKVVDSTGAGDAFAAGFVSGLIAKKSIKNSLELGTKEAASEIKHVGAKNKLIKMDLKK